jgi:hypothetical protein
MREPTTIKVRRFANRRTADEVDRAGQTQRARNDRLDGFSPTGGGRSRSDWWLIVGGAIFVFLGAIIVPSDPAMGICGIAFFAGPLCLGLVNIVQKRRFLRPAPLRVEIAGGVPIPASRAVLITGGVWCCGIAVAAAFAQPVALLFLVFGFGGLGAYVFWGLATGRFPADYLQFDPGGITFGRWGWSFSVAWDDILSVGADLQEIPILYIMLPSPDVAHIERRRGRPKVFTLFGKDSVPNPIHINPIQYGFDLKLLLKALRRYLVDPRARAELGRRSLLAPPT